MGFSFKKTEMELGYTLIENVFIDELLPMAKGIYVKVYLLAYKYAKNKSENSHFSHSHISKRLGIPLSDVLEAWDYWEKLSAIEKVYYETNSDDSSTIKNNINFHVVFNSLTELYINSALNAKEKTQKIQEPHKNSFDRLISASQNPITSQMFKDVENIIRRALGPKEKNDILEALENFSMDPELVTCAFQFSSESKGKTHPNYVIGILKNWFHEGIRTKEDYLGYVDTNSDRNYIYSKVRFALGSSNPNASSGEKYFINKWIDEYNFSLDMILKACEQTASTLNPNIKYLDSIIEDWYKNGVKDLESAIAYSEKSNSDHNKNKSKYNKINSNNNQKITTKFHNFEQRVDEYTEEEIFNILTKNKYKED